MPYRWGRIEEFEGKLKGRCNGLQWTVKTKWSTVDVSDDGTAMYMFCGVWYQLNQAVRRGLLLLLGVVPWLHGREWATWSWRWCSVQTAAVKCRVTSQHLYCRWPRCDYEQRTTVQNGWICHTFITVYPSPRGGYITEYSHSSVCPVWIKRFTGEACRNLHLVEIFPTACVTASTIFAKVS